jgi:hypothetical protein
MSQPTPARNRCADAHEAAAKQLDALAPYSEWADEEEADPEKMPATADVWCGCETCQIREALAVAWPHALAQAADLIKDAAEIGPGRLHAVNLLREEARKATLPGQDVPA